MSQTITIISIGPGDPELINEKTRKALLGKKKLVLRTEKHPAAEWLSAQEISFETLDRFYEDAEDFDSLAEAVSGYLWKAAADEGKVVYAVSDPMTDHTVDLLFGKRPDRGEISIIPGFSYADYYLSSCRRFFSTSDIRLCSACDFSETEYNPDFPVLITELNDEITAGQVKQRLSVFLDDETEVYFLCAGKAPKAIQLFELDRQPSYDHLSAVAAPGVPLEKRRGKTLSDLLRIMDLLRSPDGCPWDRAQTHESLKPYVVEEAWEVVGSIEENDTVHLSEELGDLLFQVVFHASVAKAFDEFSMDDVITGICDKMIRRHPHVFRKDSTAAAPFSAESWDRIKQDEKGTRTIGETMMGISGALPSLRCAEKVLRQLDRIPSLRKSRDEAADTVARLSRELTAVEDGKREEILGNLLFVCADLARQTGTDSEILLHHTVKRIVQKFLEYESMEKKAPAGRDCLTFKDLGVY